MVPSKSPEHASSIKQCPHRAPKGSHSNLHSRKAESLLIDRQFEKGHGILDYDIRTTRDAPLFSFSLRIDFGFLCFCRLDKSISFVACVCVKAKGGSHDVIICEKNNTLSCSELVLVLRC